MSEFRVLELLQEIKGLIIGTPKSDRWMNINEASKYCGVSSQTLRRNVKDNKLKASSKIGKMLFKEAELENWLNG